MSQDEKSANRRNAYLLLPGLALGVACASALLLMVAGVGSRFGLWHFRTGFTLLGYGAYGGVGAALLHPLEAPGQPQAEAAPQHHRAQRARTLLAQDIGSGP